MDGKEEELYLERDIPTTLRNEQSLNETPWHYGQGGTNVSRTSNVFFFYVLISGRNNVGRSHTKLKCEFGFQAAINMTND